MTKGFEMSEGRARFIDSMCKIVAVVGFIVGGGWTLYTYFDHLHETAKTASIEARKPFQAKQMDLYVEVAELASKAALDPQETKDSPEVKKLIEITEGKAEVLADQEVREVMREFTFCFERTPACTKDQRLTIASKLAFKCRTSIAVGWDVFLPPDQITKARLEQLRN